MKCLGLEVLKSGLVEVWIKGSRECGLAGNFSVQAPPSLF